MPTFHYLKKSFVPFCSVLFLLVFSVQMKAEVCSSEDIQQTSVSKQTSEVDLVELANEFVKKNKMAESIKIYCESIKNDKQIALAHNNLAFVYAQLERYQDAIDAQTIAINSKLKNDNLELDVAQAYYNLGSFNLKAKNYYESLEALEKSLELNPNWVAALNDKGVVLSHLKQLPEAISFYKKAIALDKNFSLGYFNIGTAYLDLGNYKEAQKYFYESIRINPKSIEAYFFLGATKFRMGDKKEAVKMFDKVLEINPNFAEAHYYLSIVYMEQNKTSASLEHFSKVKSLNDEMAQRLLKTLQSSFVVKAN